MNGGDEAELLNKMARAYPSVTAVRVKDAIDIVSGLLGQMLAAIRGANVLTLLTGVLVLAGALAAGLSERLYEAVVLKTYGATKRQLVGAFTIEYAALGLAAAVFGIGRGLARLMVPRALHPRNPVELLVRNRRPDGAHRHGGDGGGRTDRHMDGPIGKPRALLEE